MLWLGLTASADAQPAQEPGAAVQVYSLEEPGLTFVPSIGANQTPNYDQIHLVVAVVAFAQDAPWAALLPGNRLVVIRTQLTIPEPGGYMIRVSGSGALRLHVGSGSHQHA